MSRLPNQDDFMKRNALTIIVGAVLLLIFILLLFVFQVRQSEVAVVTTFGKPTWPITNAGPHLRLPWPIQTVHRFDQRVQNFEDKQTEGLTRDGKEDMEAVGAIMTSGLNTAEALGQEIARGGVIGTLMEYEHGLVSADPLGDFALVITLFDNAASIGRVRHMVKASRNEILEALDIA